MQADQRQRGEHHHDPLREIEHAGRLEDQDEAERDQGVEHAGDEAVPQRLHQEIRRRAHLHERIDEYLVENIHAPYRCLRTLRRPLTLPRLRASAGASYADPVRLAEIGADDVLVALDLSGVPSAILRP